MRPQIWGNGSTVCFIPTEFLPSGTGQARVNNVVAIELQTRHATPSIGAGILTMTTITRVKLGFVVLGLVLFIVGVWQDDARWRYAAIGCIAIAWAMRFFRAERPSVERPPNE